MKFGDYLRDRREAKGWTQPEAALKVGIEQSYLSKLETGKSYPSEDVFARLVKSFGVSGEDVVAKVASAELSRLKEIGDIRAAVLDRRRSERVFARGWLVATLFFLLAGGACLGLTLLAEDTEWYEHEFTSMGILKLDEPLDAFDLVHRELPPNDPNIPNLEELRARQRDLTNRLDVQTRVTRENLGQWYVEEAKGGRQVFLQGPQRAHIDRSPLHWFIVPACAFLIGSLGCAFISFRWR